MGAKKRRRSSFLGIGKLILLSGVLFVIFLVSTVVSMRLVVRAKEVAVPALVGTELEEASRLLKAVNLKLALTGERYDPTIPKGAIVYQLPGTGVLIKANREVQVLLSLGKQRDPVPELVGSTERVALLRAQQSGYKLGDISRIWLSELESEQVINQFPAPDTQEITGAEIDILVARRQPKRYIMVDVAGQSLNRVLMYFEEQGFKVGEIQYTRHAKVRRGVVIRQAPEPGHVLEEGDSIHLEVAR
jgi:beta-lactam-binding protein with PASTA domain